MVRTLGGDTLGEMSSGVWRAGLYSLGHADPVARVHAMRAAGDPAAENV